MPEERQQLDRLTEAAVLLAARLPGELQRLRLRVGEAELDVSWGADDTADIDRHESPGRHHRAGSA